MLTCMCTVRRHMASSRLQQQLAQELHAEVVGLDSSKAIRRHFLYNGRFKTNDQRRHRSGVPSAHPDDIVTDDSTAWLSFGPRRSSFVGFFSVVAADYTVLKSFYSQNGWRYCERKGSEVHNDNGKQNRDNEKEERSMTAKALSSITLSEGYLKLSCVPSAPCLCEAGVFWGLISLDVVMPSWHTRNYVFI